MQIFRPYRDHEKSAKYLDDSRLNKQVLECFQVIKSCLTKLELMDGKSGWFNHPITQHVWNDGKPFIPDLYNFMMVCNREWLRRGKNRGIDFTNQMNDVCQVIKTSKEFFSWKPLPMFYSYQDTRTKNNVPRLYRDLLREKWKSDKRSPRCSINIIRE
jgi:hypothetical protein